MKTSEEILFEKFQSQDKVGLIRSELVVLIAEAMQAYADQQVKAEREKVNDLTDIVCGLVISEGFKKMYPTTRDAIERLIKKHDLLKIKQP